MRRIAFAVLASMVVPLATLPATPVFAQQSQLPPALKAALNSGDAARIKSALITLSGADARKLAGLTSLVAAEAEKLLATNPLLAVNGLSAVLDLVNTAAFKAANPDAAAPAAAAAGRIIASPQAQRAAPLVVAGVVKTITAIATTPSVFQASPSAAKTVLSAAVEAAKSQTLLAVVPNLGTVVKDQLVTAKDNKAITNADASFVRFVSDAFGEEGDDEIVLPPRPQMPVNNPSSSSPN